MIQEHVDLVGADALDLGCGVGMYTARMAEAGARAIGLEIELPRAVEARERGLDIVAAVGEQLPAADASLDVVLLHEVLEHVADDQATVSESLRALRPGGRLLIFVPNRWWPFETHGIWWRGRYHFGNKPLVNWLPDAVRNRLAPHVRVYTGHGLRALFDELPGTVVLHTRIFPGFDKLATRRPALARALRAALYAAERSPLRVFGLSHWLVVERLPNETPQS